MSRNARQNWEKKPQRRAGAREMCAYLLESAMGASKLPAALQKHVKAQFAGGFLSLWNWHKAVEEARGLVSELTGGMTGRGLPG